MIASSKTKVLFPPKVRQRQTSFEILMYDDVLSKVTNFLNRDCHALPQPERKEELSVQESPLVYIFKATKSTGGLYHLALQKHNKNK